MTNHKANEKKDRLVLHKILYLYETSSEFYIQPAEQPNESIIIDRRTCEISLNYNFSVSLLPANATSCLIYGIVGIKRLINCRYLIVISEASQCGLIDDKLIYRMDKARLIPFNQELDDPHGEDNNWNDIYVSMLESVLKTPHFYFSYYYDLTNTLQENYRLKFSENKAHHDYDTRFLWNKHLMEDFDNCENECYKYRLPFIHGFVSINRIEPVVSTDAYWHLISRRSVRRAGTRFNCRGIDNDGNVANFVETEHILELKYARALTSYVQIRGSIPLMWSQKPDYRYKPAIRIYDNNDFADREATIKHFNELTIKYERVSVVCLIDKRGHEGQLEHAFSQRMDLVQKTYNNPVPYHYFDFHKECARMRWYRLNILLERIEDEISRYGFFACHNDSVVQNQSGVIRSNCIDSLDRTNVIQSMIADRVLQAQGRLLRTITSTSSSFGSEYDVFKNAWADNADILSIQYAGTPALKTDFTRTGRRTYAGMARDGVNSLTRYFTNNFCDQYRQDAIDLLLGQYEGYPSPLYRPKDLTSYTSTLSVTIFVLTLVALYIYLRY